MGRKTNQLILLVGDAILRKKKLSRIISEILPQDHDRSFNCFRPDLKEIGMPEFVTQLKSFPMMGTAQVFLISDLPKFKKDDIKMLSDYLENPAAWSYIVISVDEIEESHPFDQIIKSFGERIDCAQDEKRSRLDFVHDRLKKEGKSISKEAWQYLEEKTGGNLTLLDSCMEKLLLYANEGGQISTEMVERLADEMLIYDAYDLTDAIAAKQPEKALRVFRFLYELEESAVMVIGLIHWQLKRIWQGKVILEEKGEYEVARSLRVSSYRMPVFINQVRKFSYSDLSSAIDQLFTIDRMIKTGQLRDREALEAFIIQISTPATAGVR